MSVNPFTRQCVITGCPAPPTVRNRCATHAHRQDAHRSLTSDRAHLHLYQSARWRRTRAQLLEDRPFCECDEHRGVVPVLARVIHHRKPHGGNADLFFALDNLQPMAKDCHDKLTGRSRGVVAQSHLGQVPKPTSRVVRGTQGFTRGF